MHSKPFKILLFFLVLYFTFILRAHDYDRTPEVGHMEEMLYGWSGLYLVQTGETVSWSTLDYPTRSEVFKGPKYLIGQDKPEHYVRLFKPWLDEPPLFSLLVGYSAHLFGADRNYLIPSAYTRFPVIFISTLTSVFLFFLAKKLSGYWTGILSMLVYGLTPIMVFGSRMAVPENAIALFLVIIMILYVYFYETKKFMYLLPVPFLIGIAGLSKPTGFFLLPLSLFLTFSVNQNFGLDKVKKFKLQKSIIINCLYVFLLTLPFVGFFFWWGLRLDPEIFWSITSIQSLRPVGFNSLAFFFSSPGYSIDYLYDSWYIFCLLAAAYYLFAPKEGYKKYVSFILAYWVLVVMFTGGEMDQLYWYRYPAFPVLAIIGAWGLQELVRKSNFFTTFLAIGMMMGNRFYTVNAFRPNIQPLPYRFILSALISPSILAFVFESVWLKRITKAIIILCIVVGAYINAYYIYNEYAIVCENVGCPLGPGTWLSRLHFPILWRFIALR